MRKNWLVNQELIESEVQYSLKIWIQSTPWLYYKCSMITIYQLHVLNSDPKKLGPHVTEGWHDLKNSIAHWDWFRSKGGSKNFQMAQTMLCEYSLYTIPNPNPPIPNKVDVLKNERQHTTNTENFMKQWKVGTCSIFFM